MLEYTTNVVSSAVDSSDKSMIESSKGGSCESRGHFCEDDVRRDSGRRTRNGGTGEGVQHSIRVFFFKVSQSSV